MQQDDYDDFADLFELGESRGQVLPFDLKLIANSPFEPYPGASPGDFFATETTDYKKPWQEARWKVLHHLLEVVQKSRWGEHVVLSGSLLLHTWFGERARQPNDIDWVVRPETLSSYSPYTQLLFDDLIKQVRLNSLVDNITVRTDRVALTDIVIYGAEPGRRLTVFWQTEDKLSGAIQMDFVFREQFHTDLVQQSVSISAEKNLSLPTVSKEELLIWKLYWLQNDSHAYDGARGKDLYDATLLAENVTLPFSLFQVALGEHFNALHDPLKWKIDWGKFQKEYPWVQGDAMDWQFRLFCALTPTFSMPR